MSNHMNWTAGQLREALKEVNIVTPASFPITTLRKLYVDNVLNTSCESSENLPERTSVAERRENVSKQPVAFPSQVNIDTGSQSRSGVNLPENLVVLPRSDNSDSVQDVMTSLNAASNNFGGSVNNNNMAAPLLQTLSQTVVGLQNVVSNLVLNMNKEKHSQENQFSLEQYYNQPPSASLHNSARYGVSPEDVPHMDLVSTSLRKQIQEGRDVNLASLLIPYFEVKTSDNEKESKEDTRLKRSLSITEFITAFGRYKRIMCEAHKHRREELDKYEAIIVGIYNIYGDKFYEYHKLFSLRSANALALYKIKIDWSVRDRDLLQLISSGAKSKTCNHCGEVSHDTKFCPFPDRQPSTSSTGYMYRGYSNDNPTTDKHGRRRIVYNGSEVCNNFNTKRGCIRNSCPFTHICSQCKSKSHASVACPGIKKSTTTSVNSQTKKTI